MTAWHPAPEQPEHPFRTIYRPGASPAVRRLRAFGSEFNGESRSMSAVFATVALTLVILVGVPLGVAFPPVGAGLLLALLGALGYVTAVAYTGDAVVDTNPKLDGQPIAGDGLRILSDIDNRFAHAEKLTNQIDGGVEWAEIEAAIDDLRWDAAVEAAALTKASENYDDLVHAPDGTAMAALRRDLDADRALHLKALQRIQRIADDLYQRAGNAVAAQAIAIRRGGYRRDIALPRLSDGEAESRIESATARLLALEAALIDVDDSTKLLAERLRAETSPDSVRPEPG